MSDTNKTESLHDQIMRLQCTPPKDANVNQMLAYKSGHRDARHAAAELAAAYEADAQQAAPVAVPDENGLLPCPFCGGKAELHQRETESLWSHNQVTWSQVGCCECECVGADCCEDDDGSEAVAHRNTRAGAPSAPTPPAGQGESPCTTPEQQPVAWITIEEPFHGTAGIEAGEWDIQCDGKAIDKLASANSPGRIPLYAAPPAQQSQWVPSSKQLPPLDIPVWLSDEGRGVFIGMRSSSTDGWLWAECDAYRFFGGQWESIEAHFDDFEPSCWMPLPAAPGDAAPLAESGAQVDELAQLVAKLVQALRKASPDAPLAAKAVDYLRRKRLLNPLRDQARGDTAAPEQAEQPHPVNRSVIRDVFLRNGFTIKEGHDDLKPYVYAAAEELLALDGKEVAAEQDAVKVPRELLEQIVIAESQGDGPALREAVDELRVLLGGGA